MGFKGNHGKRAGKRERNLRNSVGRRRGFAGRGIRAPDFSQFSLLSQEFSSSHGCFPAFRRDGKALEASREYPWGRIHPKIPTGARPGLFGIQNPIEKSRTPPSSQEFWETPPPYPRAALTIGKSFPDWNSTTGKIPGIPSFSAAQDAPKWPKFPKYSLYPFPGILWIGILPFPLPKSSSSSGNGGSGSSSGDGKNSGKIREKPGMSRLRQAQGSERIPGILNSRIECGERKSGRRF